MFILMDKKAVKMMLRSNVLGFLAHRIRLSDILPWVRNSILIYAILPRLSCVDRSIIGCIGTQVHGRQVTSLFNQNDVIM